jgi:hypothetical protein
MGEKDAIDGMERAFIGMADKFADVVDKKTKNYTAEAGKDITHRGLTGEDRVKFNNYSEKIMAGITSSDDIKDLQKNWWKDSKVLEAAGKFWGGHQIGEAAKTFGRSFIEDFQSHIEHESRGLDHFAVANPKVPLFFASNLGQELGFNSLGGLDQKGVKERINEMRGVRDVERQGLTNEQINGKIAESQGRINNIMADQNIRDAERIRQVNDITNEIESKYNKALQWRLEELRRSSQQLGQQPPAPAGGGGGQPRRRGWKQRGT